MPSICDPGEDLVHKGALGLDIICIPGPCAAITALVSSGMPHPNLSLKVSSEKNDEKNSFGN